MKLQVYCKFCRDVVHLFKCEVERKCYSGELFTSWDCFVLLIGDSIPLVFLLGLQTLIGSDLFLWFQLLLLSLP